MIKKVILGILLIGFMTSSISVWANWYEKVPKRQAPRKAYVSDEYQFIWFSVPKAGYTTIFTILSTHLGSAMNGHGVPFEPGRHRDYFKFAFVRNPWDRVVSTYQNKVVDRPYAFFHECFGKDFEYFVDFISRKDLTKTDDHIKLQIELFPATPLDFIGRFENFEEDLTYVLEVIGLSGVTIPHKNSTVHDHYSTYYNERTKAIIAEKYKRDIEAFGYTFEESDEKAM